MRTLMPWIDLSDIPCARAWAELEILGANIFAELIANGVTNSEGEPRRLLTELRQLRQLQLAYERDLGMTPAAKVSIKASSTPDLEAAFERIENMKKVRDTDGQSNGA